jgi:hypothetical protein
MERLVRRPSGFRPAPEPDGIVLQAGRAIKVCDRKGATQGWHRRFDEITWRIEPALKDLEAALAPLVFDHPSYAGEVGR